MGNQHKWRYSFWDHSHMFWLSTRVDKTYCYPLLRRLKRVLCWLMNLISSIFHSGSSLFKQLCENTIALPNMQSQTENVSNVTFAPPTSQVRPDLDCYVICACSDSLCYATGAMEDWMRRHLECKQVKGHNELLTCRRVEKENERERESTYTYSICVWIP